MPSLIDLLNVRVVDRGRSEGCRVRRETKNSVLAARDGRESKTQSRRRTTSNLDVVVVDPRAEALVAVVGVLEEVLRSDQERVEGWRRVVGHSVSISCTDVALIPVSSYPSPANDDPRSSLAYSSLSLWLQP